MSNQVLISCDELNRHLAHERWRVFDCRFDLADVEKGERDHGEAHIPGALYAHLDRHLSSPITEHSGRHPMPDRDALLRWLSECGLQHDMQVVVYDDSFGSMASRLWWLLKCLGHDQVALLDGGWQAWVDGGYPVNDHQVKPQPGSYQAILDASCIVSTDEVLANLREPQFVLVDVRAEERFLGINEPIDPVAGHIPNTVNIPLSLNVDQQGFYKSASELNRLYADVNARCEPARQVYMCGSGVTACHSLVAQCAAGSAMPRVYAGSWSEWIRDPSRPVVLNDALVKGHSE